MQSEIQSVTILGVGATDITNPDILDDSNLNLNPPVTLKPTTPRKPSLRGGEVLQLVWSACTQPDEAIHLTNVAKNVYLMPKLWIAASLPLLAKTLTLRHSEDKCPFESEESPTHITIPVKDSSHSVKSILNFSKPSAQNDGSHSPQERGCQKEVKL